MILSTDPTVRLLAAELHEREVECRRDAEGISNCEAWTPDPHEAAAEHYAANMPAWAVLAIVSPRALTFGRLREVNAERCAEWHPGFPSRDDPWSGADWSNAMQGEAGEAGNVVKKLRRHELSYPGNRRAEDRDEAALLAKLGEEIADALIYADLLATYYGIDLAAAVRAKFNRVSQELGLPQRL